MFKIIFRTLAAVAMMPSTFFTFDLFCLLTERTLELNHVCPFSILLVVPVAHSFLFTKAFDTWWWRLVDGEEGREFCCWLDHSFLVSSQFLSSKARILSDRCGEFFIPVAACFVSWQSPLRQSPLSPPPRLQKSWIWTTTWRTKVE